MWCSGGDASNLCLRLAMQNGGLILYEGGSSVRPTAGLRQVKVDESGIFAEQDEMQRCEPRGNHAQCTRQHGESARPRKVSHEAQSRTSERASWQTRDCQRAEITVGLVCAGLCEPRKLSSMPSLSQSDRQLRRYDEECGESQGGSRPRMECDATQVASRMLQAELS